jgi:isochorismate synthase
VSEPALVARSRRVGGAFDLLGAYHPSNETGSFFFERRGLGVAGSAGRLVGEWSGPDRLKRAAEDLSGYLGGIGIESDGRGPVAAGAFPFDDGSPATLMVLSPAVVRREPGVTTRIQVGPSSERERFFDTELAQARPRAGSPRAPFPVQRTSLAPHPSGYASAVDSAVRRIRAGELSKVVLARTLLLDAGRELDPRQLLWRLRAVDPDSFTFAAPTTGRGVLLGASPEMLVSRSGPEVRANPLAGSAPRFGDPDEDRASGRGLLASAKDREEHAITADAVADALEPYCEALERSAEPTLLGTANVWHLSTRFRGRLREPAPSVLELVGALHPTPAVCGTPRDAARATIAELEPFDRGWYAGPVGWVDAHGDGEWAIALRCAELRGQSARLFAGAGIVAASDPAGELDETDRKFRALLDSLRWG